MLHILCRSNYEFQLECLAKAGIDVEHLTLSVADYNSELSDKHTVIVCHLWMYCACVLM